MTPVRESLDSVVVVMLEPEPRLYAQLDELIDTARESSDQDVVLDFSGVGMLTTSGISRLMRLRRLLDDSGRRLILCQVCIAVKGIFAVTGLDKVLDFADRQDDALSAIRLVHNAHRRFKWLLRPIAPRCNAQSGGGPPRSGVAVCEVYVAKETILSRRGKIRSFHNGN